MLFSSDFIIFASKLICVLVYNSVLLFKWNIYSLKIVKTTVKMWSKIQDQMSISSDNYLSNNSKTSEMCRVYLKVIFDIQRTIYLEL